MNKEEIVPLEKGQPQQKTKSFTIIRFAGISALIILGIFFLFIIAGNFLTVNMKLEHADAIVVLSGNDTIRLKGTADLYLQGLSENIILTNTGNNFGDYNIPYTTHQVDVLREYGVPEGALFLAKFVAKNTGQEATGIIEQMFEMSAKSAIIVTDAWHTRRVQIIFNDSFGNTGISLQYYGTAEEGFNPNFWWLSSKGWQDVIGEYFRIIGYYIKRETNIPDYPIFDFFD
ncbi:MAG: YdcF family protein [Flexilinea sp.]